MSRIWACCLLWLLLPTPLASGSSSWVTVFHLELSPEDVESLRARFDAQQIEQLEELNRADALHLPDLDTIVVPDEWNADMWAYSPLPLEYPWAAQDSKLLVVHQPQQVFGAYEWGRLVRWGPVSTGRRALQTPAGLFHLNWRSTGRHSTVDPDWFMPWYFNFQNERGLSLHQYALPGRPASHACIRMLERDARWLYDWGETWILDERGWTVLDRGTPLLIVGCYDFQASPPWRDASLVDRVHLPDRPTLARIECDELAPDAATTLSRSLADKSQHTAR